ncbi:PlsC domain-containing protein [Mycena indigotica]|uniref:PlsC domain-containing protein n=1 Tax=Mycena indigotica TaxID=2126181 RepID=A0A8H6TFU6_9AGAR|nr:PlsC domain-containing protein [Mycena indigotica]KAF7315927.1 PlsC domain-containing protein [Mycena indigotica]
MDLQLLHRLIRTTTGIAASSFFTEIHVIGGEDCPKDIPIIVTATHHNMMLDPVILSHTFPHARILNYWSKATLFINPIVSWILYSSGNIPVDRKSRDRKVLLKGTMEALQKGYAVALFPEGTSYTEPRIMQVKDGAAWAALEYNKLAQNDPEKKKSKSVAVVPAAIVYTNKTKYRSSVIVDFGSPIFMDDYVEQFSSEAEGAPRAAVKRLTRAIEKQLVETTINAPDWNTLYAARMARDLLWVDERSINLGEYVAISQTLVDLFSTPDPTPNFKSVNRRLLEYYSLLQSTKLTNSVLSNLPLPRTLDPNRPTPVPSRLLTLLILLRDSFVMLLRIPFFIFPLVMYLPVYYMGRVGARLVKDEEETQAQNKLVFGMISMFLTYPAAFFFLWSFFLYTRVGAVMAAATLWLFARYHDTMINANYEHAKRLLATWRVLIGVWGPKRWDLSLPALTPYMTPVFPKESEFITVKAPVVPEPDLGSVEPPADLPNPKSRRKPSSRRIMRHVLRARGEAVKAVAELFEQLRLQSIQARNSGGVRLKASVHLAKIYGGVEVSVKSDSEAEGATGQTKEVLEGWREAGEVIAFLKERGAKVPQLGRSSEYEAEWAAALTSDAEFEPGN